MSSAEFIDYVGSLLPNLGQETQLKASYMLMHMITLMVGSSFLILSVYFGSLVYSAFSARSIK